LSGATCAIRMKTLAVPAKSRHSLRSDLFYSLTCVVAIRLPRMPSDRVFWVRGRQVSL
jgi:hypothetical protein